MIILQSQISDIDLNTLTLELTSKFIQTPFVNLDTLTMDMSLPTSPSIGLVQLDTLTLALSPTVIPANSPIVVALSPAVMTFVAKTIGFMQETGYAMKDLLSVLQQGGKAPVTPARFTDCDLMDIIDAFRAGTTQPEIPEDETCMMSDLLNALDIGNPIPFEVPTIGSWFGELEWPDYLPSVSDLMLRFFGTMPDETIQISTNYGESWTTHPKPSMDAEPAPSVQNPTANTYVGNGYILFSDVGVSGILYRGSEYGLHWQRVNISDIMSKPIRKIWANGTGIVFANDGDTSWSGTSPTYLLKSTNFGASWDLVCTMTGYRHIAHLAFITDDIILCIRERRIAKSTDGGVTWVDKYDDSSYGDNDSVLLYLGNGICIFVNNGWWAYEAKNRVVYSSDYGETWSVVTTPIYGYNRQGVYLGNGIVLVIKSVSESVYRSTDYGLTWTEIVLSSYNAQLTLLNCGGGKVVAVAPGGYGTRSYFLSTDYGATWDDITDNPWDNVGAKGEIFIPE